MNQIIYFDFVILSISKSYKNNADEMFCVKSKKKNKINNTEEFFRKEST